MRLYTYKNDKRTPRRIGFLTLFFFLFYYAPLLAQNTEPSPSDSLTLLGNKLLEQVDIDLSLAENEEKVFAAIAYFKEAQNWEQHVQGYNWLASVYHYYQAYEKYAQTVWLAIQKARQFLPNDKNDIHSNTLNNLAALYHQNGNFRLAIKYYQQSIDLTPLQKEFEPLRAISYHNIGKCFQDQGDFDNALRYFPRALELYQRSEDDLSQRNIPGCLMDWAKSFQEKNKLDSALVYFEKSIAAGDQIKKERGYLDQVKLLCYQNMARLFLAQEEVSGALTYVNKALKLQKGKAFEKSHTTYQILAQTHASKQNWRKQFNYLAKSKTIVLKKYQSFDKHREIANSYLEIGKFYQAQGQLDSALNHFQRALIANTLNFDTLDFMVSPPLENLLDLNTALDIIRQKGKTFYQLAQISDSPKRERQLTSALKNYKTAAQVIQQVRQTYSAEGSKLHLAGKVKPVFEEAIQVALQLYQTTGDAHYLSEAFYFSENSKAILLLESIQQDYALNAGNIPDSLLLKEQTFHAQITFYKNELSKTLGTQKENLEQQKEWKSKLFYLQEDHKKLIASFEKEYPDYFQLKFNTQLTSLEDLQKNHLSPQAALIEYFHGSKNNYAFCITSDGIDWHQWPVSSDLLQSIKQLRSLIIEAPASTQLPQNYQEFTSLSNRLFQELLAPFISKLPASVERLIFIPDEHTNYLPFETLIQKPAPPGIDFKPTHLSYLLNDFQISYNYSAALYGNNATKKRTIASKSFIGFAPDFKGNSVQNSRACNNFELSSLLCNTKEIEAIQQLWGGDIKTGIAANAATFMEQSNDYQIVHLATHACINEQNANLSQIYFMDGSINIYDLQNLRLHNELIVLSACNTGSGKIAKGEGVLSLARSFIQAGCPSALMSLWSVDDCTTSDLMIGFYQQLDRGKNKDAALQQAKLNYLKNTTDKIKGHPYFWASFVQTGNTAALKEGSTFGEWNSFRNWGFLLLALGLLFAVFFFRKK